MHEDGAWGGEPNMRRGGRIKDLSKPLVEVQLADALFQGDSKSQKRIGHGLIMIACGRMLQNEHDEV